MPSFTAGQVDKTHLGRACLDPAIAEQINFIKYNRTQEKTIMRD